jgi:hypothetical protein
MPLAQLKQVSDEALIAERDGPADFNEFGR